MNVAKIEYMEEFVNANKNEFEKLEVGESPNLKNEQEKDKGSSKLYLALTIVVTFIALFSLTFPAASYFLLFSARIMALLSSIFILFSQE